MKSFLAGLALGLAAGVAYRQRPGSRTRRRRDLRAALPSSEAKNPQPIAASPQPQPVLGSRHAAVSPAEGAKTGRPRTAAVLPARNAEEVLNSATRQQLLSVYGIGPVLADRIIQNRPYAAAYDVVEQGIIPESIFIQLRKQLLDRPS